MVLTNQVGTTSRDDRIDAYRRTFDVVLSVTLLLVVLPVILVTAVGSAVSLRAWPFFTQYRVGRGGDYFRFVKVRTLRPDVPGYTDKHRLDQSRIPAFCRLLRSLHLDELPQLLLVAQGKMSLVGPRPEMAYLHESMPDGFAELRTSVRPGCTGLWQISEASVGLIGDAPEYDRFYLANRSLRLDLWVLYRTALHMLGLGRALTLLDVPAWARRTEEDHLVVLNDPAVSDTISLPATAAR